MKKLVLLLVAAFAFSCSSNPDFYDDFLDSLNGNIATIKMKSYDAKMKFGEVMKDSESYNAFYCFQMAENGLPEVVSQYYYSNWKEKDILEYMAKFEYDGNKKMKVSYYEEDGDLHYTKHYFYIDGQLVATTCYNGNGAWDSGINHEYENGKLIKDIQVDEDENPIMETRYTYQGNLMNMTIIDCKTGEQNYYQNTEFDNNWRAISKVEDYNGEVKEIRVERNEKGYVIKSIGGTIDIFGYLSPQPINQEVYYYEYEFDDHKNWIKRIIYKGEAKTPFEITEREITYK